ncbi:MAG: GerMN domain-containing protein [Vicinamibacterales bacterium]|nr:GerMN domain-containing protein [Vicinamibacterales bacterium]
MKLKRRDIIVYTGLAGILAGALGVLLIVGPRWLTPPASEVAPPPTAPATARKIRARLLYVSEDGLHLSPVEQEVPYGEGAMEQARQIIEAQVAPPQAPLVSAIPPGTRVRTVFLTQKGEAYVDLSAELRANHPGGTANEILTAYTLVSALTMNIPAIKGVQILVDGKEIDTLAGHLDLRRPLEQDGRWISQ